MAPLVRKQTSNISQCSTHLRHRQPTSRRNRNFFTGFWVSAWTFFFIPKLCFRQCHLYSLLAQLRMRAPDCVLLRLLSSGFFLLSFSIIVGYPEPHVGCRKIINLPRMLSLPNLISRFLINQQGFDVDFGEHGRRMACLW